MPEFNALSSTRPLAFYSIIRRRIVCVNVCMYDGASLHKHTYWRIAQHSAIHRLCIGIACHELQTTGSTRSYVVLAIVSPTVDASGDRQSSIIAIANIYQTQKIDPVKNYIDARLAFRSPFPVSHSLTRHPPHIVPRLSSPIS